MAASDLRDARIYRKWKVDLKLLHDVVSVVCNHDSVDDAAAWGSSCPNLLYNVCKTSFFVCFCFVSFSFSGCALPCQTPLYK